MSYQERLKRGEPGAVDAVIGKLDEMLAAAGTPRTCNGCDLCCTAVTVWDMPDGSMKDTGVRCPHLCGAPGKSCSIYRTRPESCRVFYCMWRTALIVPQELRPADCGFVLSMHDEGGDWPVVITICRDPDRHDLANQPRYRKFFFALARLFNAIVALGEGPDASHVFSPKGNLFSRKNYPDFFTADGKVGLPETEFIGPKLTQEEQVQRLFLRGTIKLDV